MADGYYRIAGKPAATLRHCAPGLSNGLANLHNARRAKSAIVNIVGDQATYHRPFDPALAGDTTGYANSVSGWVRSAVTSAEVGHSAALAAQAAKAFPGQVATLILPSDTSWNEGGVVAQGLPALPGAPLDPYAIRKEADVLRHHKNVLILLGGQALLKPAQKLAYRIAQATGADVLGDFVSGHVARGAGCMKLLRVPYAADAARKVLEKYDQIILVSAKAPVAFFAYPNQPSLEYREDAQLTVLARDDQDPTEALQALVDELGAPAVEIPDHGPRPALPTEDAVSPEGLARVIAAVMSENAIISEEGISYTRGLYENTFATPAHDMLHLAGGAIGDGLPVATGAAVAGGGERRVIGIQADGSAMYTVQSLWTQAREQLPVTTIILSNHKYNILQAEYANVGATPGETAMRMMDLTGLDWVHIAKGMNVEAARAQTLSQLANLLQHSFKSKAPFVIELMI